MRARDLLTATLVALTAACAAQDVGEPPSAPSTPLDAPPPPVAAAEPEPSPADDELGFAEYERLLADKENRLRAAGVLLAARGQVSEEARAGGGYAPPPPAAAADEGVSTKKAKRASKSVGSGRGSEVDSRSRTPRPAAKQDSAGHEGKNVPYDPSPKPAAAPPAEYSAESGPAARCQTICDLSAATCELESKICDLASRHPDDPRYGELCRRADDDCRAAAQACQRCSP